MKINTIIIISLTFFCFLTSNALANTFPTSNVCEVKAQVTDLQKRWIAEAEPELGMYVQLSLKILETGSMIRKYSDERACPEVFTKDKEIRIGEYEKNLLGNIQTLSIGQNIRGAVVSYIKGGQLRPYYVFQAQAENEPLIHVLSEPADF